MDERLERVEVEGNADLFAAAPADVRSELGLRVARIGGGVATASSAIPGRMLNHVLGLGLNEPAGAEVLDEVRRFYADAPPGWVIAAPPHADVVREGWEPDYAWVKFRRGVEPAPLAETTLDVRVAGADDGAAFGRIAAGVFGLADAAAGWLGALPGRERWICMLAWDGDAPAATGAVFLDEGAAWLGFGATLPEFRRRGAQRALLAARISFALEAGCDVLATETGAQEVGRPDASFRNITWSGFEPAYVRDNLRVAV